MKIQFCYFAILICLVSTTVGSSQTKDRWELTVWEEFELAVTPAEISQESLDYELFAEASVAAQHNSASYYYRACLKWASMTKAHRKKLYDQRNAWFRSPISELPQVEVQQWLSKTEPALKELRKGLAGKCDWGIEDAQGLSFAELRELDLSAELTVLRELADTLRLQARLHLSKSEFKRATEVLTDTIKLSRDVTKLPSVLPSYAAKGMVHSTLSLVNEMASLPNSPNMFRAIQTLPNPVVNFRPAMRKNILSIERSFRFLDDPANSDRSDDQWRAVFLEGLEQLDQRDQRQHSNYEDTGGWDQFVASRERRLGLLLAKLFPAAKRELIKAGWDKEKLESMHVCQVIAMQTQRLWDRHKALFRGVENLTATEARVRAEQMESSDLIHGELGSFPFRNVISTQTDLLLSRWEQVGFSMNVEKLRDHLAKEGSFPNTKQFQDMSPIPNPLTDEPFEYRLLENGDAQIQSSPIDEEDFVRTRYTIKKAQR